MFCENCGKKLEQDSEFCENCGKKFNKDSFHNKTEKKMKIGEYKFIILAVSIVISSIIFGGFFYLAQVNKQESIERQQQALLEQEKLEKEQELEEQNWKEYKLEECLQKADKDYSVYVNLNGTKKGDGKIWASNQVWDTAEKNKQQDIDNCYRRYE